MSEEKIEQVIREKGLTAPRITPANINAAIVAKTYHVFPNTNLTVCCLTLRNGFITTGESACVDAANFDKELGEQIAYTHAREKIWALEGYLLAERRYKEDPLSSRPGPVSRTIAQIAQLAHEANLAYCASIGDFSQSAWVDAPDWQKISAVEGVKFHKRNPQADASASHVAWYDQKVLDGWVYGEVKDEVEKTHPAMVPYDDLPVEQQIKDHIFRSVVHAALAVND